MPCQIAIYNCGLQVEMAHVSGPAADPLNYVSYEHGNNWLRVTLTNGKVYRCDLTRVLQGLDDDDGVTIRCYSAGPPPAQEPDLLERIKRLLCWPCLASHTQLIDTAQFSVQELREAAIQRRRETERDVDGAVHTNP